MSEIRRRRLALLLASFALAAPLPASADLVADWGIIPIGSETTFTFTPSAAGTNFTDQYGFSLAGSTNISYSTSSFLASCTKGCGNPVLDFGIYDANGGLIDASGNVTLAAGTYVFQIKGTGMGSGNTAGSGGTIDFYTAGNEIVSPAPEPPAWLLMLPGILLVGWLARRRSHRGRSSHGGGATREHESC